MLALEEAGGVVGGSKPSRGTKGQLEEAQQKLLHKQARYGNLQRELQGELARHLKRAEKAERLIVNAQTEQDEAKDKLAEALRTLRRREKEITDLYRKNKKLRDELEEITLKE